MYLIRKIFIFSFLVLGKTLFSQSTEKNVIKQSEILLRKAYNATDSSEIYFKEVRKLLKTKADSASYFYFKVFKTKALYQPDSSIYYTEKAIPLLIKMDSLDRLRKVYNNAHYVKLERGNYEDALEYSHKALSMAEKLKDTALISLHLSDIGNVYHDFEDYEKGVFYGKKAYAIMNLVPKKKYKYLIFANNIIGINFDDWKKPDSALFYHYKNLKFLDKVEDTLRFTFVLNNIGNTLLKQEKYSEAKKFLSRALVMDKIKNSNYSLSSDYMNLATIAYNENQNKLAEEYFKVAENYAKKSGSIEKIRDLTLQRAWFYKKIGDYKQAYDFQEEFFVLRDSVFNKERATKVAEMETKYETEKKEKQLAETRANLAERELQVKRKNTIVFGMTALVLFIGILGFLVYRQQKLKNSQLKKESELKFALAKIETQNQLQEQRLRISRDLHDNIGSQLTFIISSIDNLKFSLKSITNLEGDKLSRISEFTVHTIYELRDTIWAMNKTNISIEDLQARILNFIEKAKTSCNVDFHFNVDKQLLDETHFNSLQGMNIYRIIQESVNNVLKHAKASKINVSLSRTSASFKNETNNDTSFKLEIVDNGKGFNLDEIEYGNGLQNIKKRTLDLNGKLEVQSELGEGTQIQVFF